METIIIADDELRIRKLVSDFLKKAGYNVIEAENGEIFTGFCIEGCSGV